MATKLRTKRTSHRAKPVLVRYQEPRSAGRPKPKTRKQLLTEVAEARVNMDANHGMMRQAWLRRVIDLESQLLGAKEREQR